MDVFNLQRYANPPNNVVGTTIFLSYILAALYLSNRIVTNLKQKHKTNVTARTQNEDQIKAARLLALVSFVTLSYHMSLFLLTSFGRWAQNKHFYRPEASTNPLHWMLETALFEDFAKELVGDGPSALWTQIALVGTWFWNVYMAQEVRTHQIGSRDLVPFLLLGQILPISFTAALFIIYTSLITPTAEKDSSESFKDGKNVPPKMSNSRAISLLLPTIAFNALLLLLPSFKDSSYLVPLVLLTRLALFLPHYMNLGKGSNDFISSAMLSAGFIVANAALLRKGYSLIQLAQGLRYGGDAVKAVSWDAMIGLVVALFA